MTANRNNQAEEIANIHSHLEPVNDCTCTADDMQVSKEKEIKLIFQY